MAGTERYGSLNWTDEVLAYAAATGRTPEVSCPLIEERAIGDAAQILPYVTGRGVTSMLDIGCGLALVDVMLARALAPRRVFLLDGAEPGAHEAGYRERMQPWAVAKIGAQMFRANADPGIEVFTLAAEPFVVDVDLIISTRSWGHHYPVSVYLESVAKSLRPGGLLAVDLRAGKGGAHEIQQAGFKFIHAIDQNSPKCARVIFERLVDK